MRKALVLTATMAVGMALLSCSAPEPSKGLSPTTTSTINPPSEQVVRAPLAPPVGYASPHAASNQFTGPLGAVCQFLQSRCRPAADISPWYVARFPSWAAVKGDGCFVVDQVPQDKSAAQSETAKFRVEKCSKEDADPNPRAARETSGY